MKRFYLIFPISISIACCSHSSDDKTELLESISSSERVDPTTIEWVSTDVLQDGWEFRKIDRSNWTSKPALECHDLGRLRQLHIDQFDKRINGGACFIDKARGRQIYSFWSTATSNVEYIYETDTAGKILDRYLWTNRLFEDNYPANPAEEQLCVRPLSLTVRLRAEQLGAALAFPPCKSDQEPYDH